MFFEQIEIFQCLKSSTVKKFIQGQFCNLEIKSFHLAPRLMGLHALMMEILAPKVLTEVIRPPLYSLASFELCNVSMWERQINLLFSKVHLQYDSDVIVVVFRKMGQDERSSGMSGMVSVLVIYETRCQSHLDIEIGSGQNETETWDKTETGAIVYKTDLMKNVSTVEKNIHWRKILVRSLQQKCSRSVT